MIYLLQIKFKGNVFMAFYSYMLEQYSTDSTFSKLPKEVRMKNVKATVEQEYINSIESNLQIADDIATYSSFSNPYRGAVVAQHQAESLRTLAKSDSVTLSYLKSISPEEYFSALVKKEERELSEHLDDSYEKVGAATEKLIKLEASKGISSKFYKLTGKLDQKIGEATDRYNQANNEVLATQDALVEWQDMSYEARTDYLLERFEQSGLLNFDRQSLSAYALQKQAGIDQSPQLDIAETSQIGLDQQ